jgi:hypothetical protein
MGCASLVALANTQECGTAMGGGKLLYLIAYSDTIAPADANPGDNYIIDDTTGVLSALGLASGKTFVKVATLKESLGMSETLTSDATKNVAYYTQNLPFSVGLSTPERQFVKSILNNPVVALFQSRTEGKFYIAGLDGNLMLTASERNLGTALGDGLSNALTLSGASKELIAEVPDTLVKTLIGS